MPSKKYMDAYEYEKRLHTAFKRMGVTDYHFDYRRKDAFVDFIYKGRAYRLEHSVEKSQNCDRHADRCVWGSDCFAQIVLTIQDLARMAGRKIYDLSVFIDGLPPALPEPIPDCFLTLGLDHAPKDRDEIKSAYRRMAAGCHPDAGGSDAEFHRLQKAYQEAMGRM